MSYTDIRTREGMPYGGLPLDSIVYKLEETDPQLVGEVRGDDPLHDVEAEYDDYARGEITDWAPDAPYLEADHSRRDPAFSRGVLNLRYNGTRGFDPNLPRWEGGFWGFTGNDPRGALTDPRFDVMRGHITARAANLEARMLDSDDNFEAERPWTNQSISYGMKELQRRIQNSTRVFGYTQEGRPWGRNQALDELAHLRTKQIQYWNGQEGMQDAGGRERFFGGDHRPADGGDGGAVRGVDRGASTDTAPWRHAVPDGDLEVQQYGQSRGQGRTYLGAPAQGGAKVQNTHDEQDVAATDRRLATPAARGANRQVLAATLAVAAAHRRSLRAGRPEDDPGVSYEAAALGRSAAHADAMRAYRRQAEDADRRPAGEVQDDEGGRDPAARLRPPARGGAASRAGGLSQPDAHLAAVGAVRGLREGTASGQRRAAGRAEANGVISNNFEGRDVPRGRTPRPGDSSRAPRFTDADVVRPRAVEARNYRAAAPVANDRRAAHGAHSASADFGRSDVAARQGQNKRPEFRSHTQVPAELGDTDGQVFGMGNTVGRGGMNGGTQASRRLSLRDLGDEGLHETGSPMTEIARS